MYLMLPIIQKHSTANFRRETLTFKKFPERLIPEFHVLERDSRTGDSSHLFRELWCDVIMRGHVKPTNLGWCSPSPHAAGHRHDMGALSGSRGYCGHFNSGQFSTIISKAKTQQFFQNSVLWQKIPNRELCFPPLIGCSDILSKGICPHAKF